MSRYRIFNQVIESAFPLPELPAASGEPQLVISEYSPATEQVEPFEQRYVWRGPDGVEICRVSRLTGCYQFSYPDQATFLIPDAGHMLCTRASSCSPETFRHLLINQAIPRLMAHRGRLILHASAVSLKAGECFLFLGDSGYGKSTLAAALLAGWADAGAQPAAHEDNEAAMLRSLVEQGADEAPGSIVELTMAIAAAALTEARRQVEAASPWDSMDVALLGGVQVHAPGGDLVLPVGGQYRTGPDEVAELEIG